MKHYFLLGISLIGFGVVKAQTDSTSEEDDFSMYEELDFADEGAKRYCSPKIEGLSPAQLIYVGYDVQGPYTMKADPLTNRAGDQILGADEMDIAATH